MVAIKKRETASLETIPKPVRFSLKPSKEEIDILPPPPPPEIKAKKKVKIPKPIKDKKGLDIPIPLKEKSEGGLPPPPLHIPFDLIHSKEKDRASLKELKFKEKKKQKKLKEEDRSKEKEIKRNDKALKKEINALYSALKTHTKTIDKYEKLLSEDPERLMKIDKKLFGQIKQELKSEEEYKENSKKMKSILSYYNKLARNNETYLKKEIEEINDSYETYTHKAEGIRNAIFAKIDSIDRIRRRKEGEAVEAEKEKIQLKLQREKIVKEKEEPFIERERKKLEKLKEAETKETETKEKAEELEIPELEAPIEKEEIGERIEIPELKELPELEGLPEIEEPLPIEKPLEREEIQKKEIAEVIEKLKSRKPIEAGHEFREGIVHEIDQMINDARESLLNLNVLKAKYTYIEIMKIYNRLDNEKKKRVYESIKELYDERKSAEAMLNR